MNLTRIIDIYDALHLPRFLISVNIEPTNHCQLSCVTCYRKGRETGYMSWETFEESARQIYDISTVSGIGLNFAGEPLLHPRFMDMVDHFAEKKTTKGKPYNVGFSTNGLLPFADAIDKVNGINISLDGVGEAHKTRRRGSSYEVVESNILEALSRKRHRTRIGVNLVPSGQSNAEILEFREHWKGKVDYAGVGSYHSPDMRLIDQGDQDTRSWGTCRQLRHAAVIMWDGRLTTCCGDLKGINVCGNILGRRLKDSKTRAGPLCKTCDSWKII